MIFPDPCRCWVLAPLVLVNLVSGCGGATQNASPTDAGGSSNIADAGDGTYRCPNTEIGVDSRCSAYLVNTFSALDAVDCSFTLNWSPNDPDGVFVMINCVLVPKAQGDAGESWWIDYSSGTPRLVLLGSACDWLQQDTTAQVYFYQRAMCF